jgi:multicomponent Na+:H+ antiporter subunit B
MTGSLILRNASRLLLPAAIIFSIYLLWRGHNEPGGGFVGGLIAAAGVTVHALPRGRSTLRTLLQAPPQRIAGVGVLLSLSSGLASLVAGEAFMTHRWHFFKSGFAVGTPLAFDLGVYLVVFGAVLTFLSYYLES